MTARRFPPPWSVERHAGRPLSLIAIFDLHSSLAWGAAWLNILIIIQL
jgi:hypothetical protein